ncbi:hypothetical protein TA3x_004275 [Tundrisphaera sp. TA3]|uniref:hypothetical protein n=1 Tax=Tundrisphaera sp. TA3 TaxID=3435775 RepID=UPI003EB7020F
MSKVKLWRTWNGDPQDNSPINESNCPALRLTPYQDGAGPIDDFYDAADLMIRYETFVSGNNVADLMDLDEAVYRAIYPIDPVRAKKNETIWDELQTDVTFEQYGIWDKSFDVRKEMGENAEKPILRGEGLIRMQFNLER